MSSLLEKARKEADKLIKKLEKKDKLPAGNGMFIYARDGKVQFAYAYNRYDVLPAKQISEKYFKNVDVTASTLVFMTDFLNLEWIRIQPEKIRDQVVERMIEIVLNGLKRRN